jgi:hypothetical protein
MEDRVHEKRLERKQEVVRNFAPAAMSGDERKMTLSPNVRRKNRSTSPERFSALLFSSGIPMFPSEHSSLLLAISFITVSISGTSFPIERGAS